jgi:hypothetical protein
LLQRKGCEHSQHPVTASDEYFTHYTKHSLKTAYDKAVLLKLLEVQGLKPHCLFASAIIEIAPNYAKSLKLRLLELAND